MRPARWHLVACFFAIVAVVLCSAQLSHLIEVLAEVAPTLRDTTSVPLRFPSHIPILDKETELYAITRSVDGTGYEVVLGATPDCRGQHACSYGFLIGTTRPISSIVSDRRGSAVALFRGINASFYDTVCGGYCNESLIVWSEGKYHYIIGLKAEKKSNMILVANSAIEGARRK
jgi:hypothetical protein